MALAVALSLSVISCSDDDGGPLKPPPAPDPNAALLGAPWVGTGHVTAFLGDSVFYDRDVYGEVSFRFSVDEQLSSGIAVDVRWAGTYLGPLGWEEQFQPRLVSSVARGDSLDVVFVTPQPYGVADIVYTGTFAHGVGRGVMSCARWPYPITNTQTVYLRFTGSWEVAKKPTA